MKASCFPGIALAVLCLTGCDDLARHGVNTVPLKYGVTRDSTFFSGERVTGLFIENSDKTATHTNARVELEFILKDGELLKKTFAIGTLKPGEKWTKQLESPLTKVSTMDVLYTCEQGACKGTLDIEHPENNRSAEERAIETVLKLDREAGRTGGGAAKVIMSMKGIDLQGCPAKFQEAYGRHIVAWEQNDSNAIKSTFAKVKEIALEYGIDESRIP